MRWLEMQILINYALSMVGTPYIWGGEGPPHIGGYDCSGFIQELLRSVGFDPPGDQTAQALYDYFEKKGQWNRSGAGVLVFYGKGPSEITHIAMMIDVHRVIEAGGGNSSCRTREDAIRQGAFVRVRHHSHRSDEIARIRPDYGRIGLL